MSDLSLSLKAVEANANSDHVIQSLQIKATRIILSSKPSPPTASSPPRHPSRPWLNTLVLRIHLLPHGMLRHRTPISASISLTLFDLSSAHLNTMAWKRVYILAMTPCKFMDTYVAVLTN
jgi:hypothetical protein